MIVDGRAIAQDILRATKEETVALGRDVRVRAVTVAPSGATKSYLKIKMQRAADAGIALDIKELGPDATAQQVIDAVQEPGADAVIVQLPLPASIDQDIVLDSIPADKDADVLSEAAYARFAHQEADALMPPVAGAVAEILECSGVVVAGKRALVVGAGQLVGQPVFEWLQHNGASAIAVTKTSQDALPLLAPAMDIIVTGAGSPGIITPDLIKDGVVLVDAGTSESDGQIAGDVDPDCAGKASVFTPVPGGVGPVAVACLFRNAAKLAARRALTNPTA